DRPVNREDVSGRPTPNEVEPVISVVSDSGFSSTASVTAKAVFASSWTWDVREKRREEKRREEKRREEKRREEKRREEKRREEKRREEKRRGTFFRFRSPFSEAALNKLSTRLLASFSSNKSFS